MRGQKPDLRLVEKNEDGSERLIEVETPCPGPSDHLSFEAKMEWVRVAPILHKQGRLNDDIWAMLESYCVNVGMARECQQQIDVDGIVVNGKRHPAFSVMNACMKEARLLASELQLTRQKGKKPEGEEEGTQGWGKDAGLLA